MAVCQYEVIKYSTIYVVRTHIHIVQTRPAILYQYISNFALYPEYISNFVLYGEYSTVHIQYNIVFYLDSISNFLPYLEYISNFVLYGEYSTYITLCYT
jgi:hypothetical protein